MTINMSDYEISITNVMKAWVFSYLRFNGRNVYATLQCKLNNIILITFFNEAISSEIW